MPKVSKKVRQEGQADGQEIDCHQVDSVGSGEVQQGGDKYLNLRDQAPHQGAEQDQGGHEGRWRGRWRRTWRTCRGWSRTRKVWQKTCKVGGTPEKGDCSRPKCPDKTNFLIWGWWEVAIKLEKNVK